MMYELLSPMHAALDAAMHDTCKQDADFGRQTPNQVETTMHKLAR
jgi:hypothetical protein